MPCFPASNELAGNRRENALRQTRGKRTIFHQNFFRAPGPGTASLVFPNETPAPGGAFSKKWKMRDPKPDPDTKCPAGQMQNANCKMPIGDQFAYPAASLAKTLVHTKIARVRNSRNSGKCGVCHWSLVMGIHGSPIARRLAQFAKVQTCPKIALSWLPAIFRKFRTFATSPVHHFTPSPIHAGRWALPPAARRTVPAIFSKISTRFSKKTTSIGKYGKYTCVFTEENAYFPMGKLFHAPLENINPVFSRAKSISPAEALGKYGKYGATEIANRCRHTFILSM